MRKISAVLAIVMSLSWLLWSVREPYWTELVTSGVFAVVLLAAGIATLRGGDLIYLAAAWALHAGLYTAAFVGVIYNFSRDEFGSALITVLFVAAMLGLLTAFVAHQRERRI